jgi:3-deoxy-7-phosphoheptulonate synthase
MILARQFTSRAWNRRRIDDVRVLGMTEITTPVDLLSRAPITEQIRDLVHSTREAITRILSGEDSRILVVVGPCSVHNVAATLEYAKWVLQFRRAFGSDLLIMMRVYFEKPRTRGGWKGLINDPHLDGSFRINEGLALARKLLLDINSMGVPTATEFVDLITPQYLSDLISWAAIGARTSESPVHRELASGLSCPVGFKNGTSGDVTIAINAVVTASRPHHFLGVTKLGRAAIVSTTGNGDCHIILRGGARPNYDEASIAAACALLRSEAVCPRVMVDCSHRNCGGDYRRQLVVAQEVARQLRGGSADICGLMVESNLMPGAQTLARGCQIIPGMSITDPCVGIDDTAALLTELAGRDASALTM